MTLTTRVQFSRPRRRVWLPGGGGAAASSATLSATDKNGNVTMSNGNLTATNAAAAFGAGRGDTTTTLIGAGAKRFWGTRINVAGGINDAGAGFCTASQTFGDGAFLGQQPNGAGYYNGTGEVYYDNTLIFTRTAPAAGDIVWQAYDRTIDRWWTAVNDSDWNDDPSADPATGVGGVDVSVFGDVFPAYCGRNGGSVTLIPGPTFDRVAPVGFSGFA